MDSITASMNPLTNETFFGGSIYIWHMVYFFFFNEKNALYIQKDIRLYKEKCGEKSNCPYMIDTRNVIKACKTGCPNKTKVHHSRDQYMSQGRPALITGRSVKD
jgi:hypothetical protein